jgi:phosphate-selective porin OprO/OprP
MLHRSVSNRRLATVLALAGFISHCSVARGEEPAPEPPAVVEASAQAEPVPAELEGRVRQLEEQLRQLQETLCHLLEERAAAGRAVDSAEVQKLVDEQLKKHFSRSPGWQDGFSLQSADGSFRLRLRGYLQSDARAFLSSGGETGADSFFLRRVRPIFEGTLYRHFDFRIMPDFGGGSTSLQDAHLDIRYWPAAQLRFGKFKTPFSLERLQSGADLLFIERSIANNLAPNRDVGVQLYGDLARGTLSYQVGVFNGALDTASVDGDAGDDKDIAARVFAQPFRNRRDSALQGLGVGLAVTTGKRDEAFSGVSYRTAGRFPFFRYDTAVVGDGAQTRWSPQFHYYHGPVGLMGEYAESRQKVREGDARGDLTHRGWYLQGSYVLTGEKASYRNIAPAKPFDPRNGEWGAFELAFRWGQVTLDRDAFTQGFADPATSAREATAYTLGLNWYLNRAVKAQLNYERTDFDRAIPFGARSRDHEDLFLTRFQIAY